MESVWADTTSWLAPLGLFVLEYTVCQRLRHAGVEPTAVCGHSLGHFLAAHVAGLVSLHQALIMLLRRSHLLHTSIRAADADSGCMLSISATEEDIVKLLTADVEVAGVNSPSNTVVAGSTPGIQALSDKCTAASIRSVKLHTSHAFHSSFIEHIMADYTSTLQLMTTSDIADTGLVSCSALLSCTLADTVTGTLSSGPAPFSVDYWVKHTRRAVLFQAAVSALAAKQAGSVCASLLRDGTGSHLRYTAAADARQRLCSTSRLRLHWRADTGRLCRQEEEGHQARRRDRPGQLALAQGTEYGLDQGRRGALGRSNGTCTVSI